VPEQAEPFTVDARSVVDQLRPARVDPDRITRVLTNLLGNALLATPSSGTVTVTARRASDRGEVVVTDTGVGLAMTI
jgi:signal transduction histidine kinase